MSIHELTGKTFKVFEKEKKHKTSENINSAKKNNKITQIFCKVDIQEIPCFEYSTWNLEIRQHNDKAGRKKSLYYLHCKWLKNFLLYQKFILKYKKHVTKFLASWFFVQVLIPLKQIHQKVFGIDSSPRVSTVIM